MYDQDQLMDFPWAMAFHAGSEELWQSCLESNDGMLQQNPAKPARAKRRVKKKANANQENKIANTHVKAISIFGLQLLQPY